VDEAKIRQTLKIFEWHRVKEPDLIVSLQNTTHGLFKIAFEDMLKIR